MFVVDNSLLKIILRSVWKVEYIIKVGKINDVIIFSIITIHFKCLSSVVIVYQLIKGMENKVLNMILVCFVLENIEPNLI